jgi:hypothetical protein
LEERGEGEALLLLIGEVVLLPTRLFFVCAAVVAIGLGDADAGWVGSGRGDGDARRQQRAGREGGSSLGAAARRRVLSLWEGEKGFAVYR